MQNSIEIPEDHEVTYMQKEKLEQEFRRMREMKRQAEKQNMEAKQTTQRVSPSMCVVHVCLICF